MKQQEDWRDILGAMNLPEGPEETQPEETEAARPKPPRQKLVIDVERKGRGGKTATIISGFTLTDDEISEVAARLKKKLGTGGSARGGEILIQGDRRADVTRALKELGL